MKRLKKEGVPVRGAKPRLTDQDLSARVCTITILVNLVLFTVKLAAGILAHSGAMVSDAVHSASDVLTTLIVIAGVFMSQKQSDKEHPYGHERLECVAGALLAVFLFMTGAAIGIRGIEKIVRGFDGPAAIPGRPALAAAVLSIGVKEWMYWYARAAARKVQSSALMADAWHHRSDALSSVGALLGIGGARMGYAALDPAAGVVICLLIGKTALDIFLDSMNRMVDKSCDDKTVERIREVVLAEAGVEQIDEVRTRLFGSRAYVDVEIAADGNLTLNQSHDIAERVHRRVEESVPCVKHCMVHVNPMGTGSQGRDPQNG